LQQPASVLPAAKLRLTETMLTNAEYHSPDWGDYQLIDGVFYRTPATSGESPQIYSSQLSMPTFGDLNADGFQDAVVVLSTYNGGNGNTKELALVIDQGGIAINTSTIPLGFMVGVEAIRVESGTVTINMRISGANDAL